MSELSWALTVPRPASWAIAHGHQNVYNRPFSTEQRGWIAICAGAGMDDELLDRTSRLTGRTREAITASCTGVNVVVAVARLVDVCEGQPCDCGPWANKRLIHWKLADAVPLAEPVPAPHIFGIWKMSSELVERVSRHWALAQRTDEAAVPVVRTDFAALRDELLPLPSAEQGYRHALLLGTTGAGKTTVVRQLLGTDPATERFPSTSTAKTTVADTELILTAEAHYRAAITFADRDEVTFHLRDNVWEAAKAVFEGRPEDKVHDTLLDHVSQRYRFSYLLGRAALRDGPDAADDLDDDDDDTDAAAAAPASANDPGTTELIRTAIRALQHVVGNELIDIQNQVTADGDGRPLEEIVEDELETRVRRSAVCGRIVDALLSAIEDRFALLTDGELHRGPDGWPVSWAWDTADRAEFLHVITRFSSNRAAHFGRLLTPLVNGIRVAGPFRPLWAEAGARLVLIDGEGLGHTPGSVAEVSTPLRRRLDEVDAIVLVDNAQQPMQAAPVAVMRTAAATGNGEKLFFLFTHFDMVKGDNLRTFSDRERHVLGSAENVLSDVREELGVAERVLRRRLDEARFFVGGIDAVLTPDRIDPARSKAPLRTVRQLNGLLEALTAETVQAETGPSRPVYKSGRLTEAVIEAVTAFHVRWRGALGLSWDTEVPKKHWASVKALTRRLSEGHVDEYKDLRPAASLRTVLEYAIYRMVQDPVRWTGPEPDPEEQQILIGDISGALTKRLVGLVDRLITEDPRPQWRAAYETHGKGSTTRRAQILIGDIYEEAVPRPLRTEPYENGFARAVHKAFTEVASDFDFILE